MDVAAMDVAVIGAQIPQGERALLANIVGRARAFALPLAGPPAYGRVAIVRAGVGYQFAGIIVRAETGSLGIVAERELQDGHAGKAELRADGFHLRGDHAEVFGYQRQVA